MEEPKDRGIAMVFSELRTLSPHDCASEYVLWPEVAGTPQADIDARVMEAAKMLRLQICSTVARQPSPAAAPARCDWPRACAQVGVYFSMSRCRTLTPSYAPNCVLKSSACMHGWAQR